MKDLPNMAAALSFVTGGIVGVVVTFYHAYFNGMSVRVQLLCDSHFEAYVVFPLMVISLLYLWYKCFHKEKELREVKRDIYDKVRRREIRREVRRG